MSRAVIVVFTLLLTGCSLHRQASPPLPPKTVVVETNKALDWSVAWSYIGADYVQLNYRLCPKQQLVGEPRVAQSSESITITLWATPAQCTNPVTKNLRVSLGAVLGNRALANPSLVATSR